MKKKQPISKEVIEQRGNGAKSGEMDVKDNSVTNVTTTDVKPIGVLFSSTFNTRSAYTNDSVVNTVELNSGLADLGGQFDATIPMQNIECIDRSAVNNEGMSRIFLSM
nr:hypothetical protein CFP56_15859 [Quercus suber]